MAEADPSGRDELKQGLGEQPPKFLLRMLRSSSLRHRRSLGGRLRPGVYWLVHRSCFC